MLSYIGWIDLANYRQSAGAASVGFHLTAYNGRDDNLFRGGIMESGKNHWIQYLCTTGLDRSHLLRPRALRYA